MSDAVKASEGRAASPSSPSRGRPTRSRVAFIEKSIVSTAMTLFLENGYAATSMEAVAVQAGVSKGTLYARYPTKAHLFHDIVSDRLSAWAAETTPVVRPAGGEVADYLRAYGQAMLHSLRNSEVVAFDRLIGAESGRFPELAKEFHEQGADGAISELARSIGREGAASDQPCADARSVAVAFYSALLGWFRDKKMRGDPSVEECNAFAAKLVDLFVRGRQSW